MTSRSMRALLGSAVLLGMVAAAAVPEPAFAQQGRQRPNGQEQEEQEAKTYQDVVGEAESDEGLFTLTWRAMVPLKKNIFEIPQVLVGRKSRAWWRARELGKAYYTSLADLAAERKAEALEEED